MMRGVLNKSQKQNPTKQQLYSIGPKYVVSERKEFTEKKNSKLEF